MFNRRVALMAAGSMLAGVGMPLIAAGPAYGLDERDTKAPGERRSRAARARRHGRKLRPNRRTISRRVRRQHRRA
jgi:hypothetical protein